MGDDHDADDEDYADQYVLDELARLSAHTSDELQSRIQEVFMWLRGECKAAMAR